MDNKKRILVAEDDSFLARAYEGKLTRLGYEVKIAKDGDETLVMMESFDPNLLILDIMMPKKNGFDVLADIRQDPRWANLPVIVATNLAQPEDVVRAKELRADYYVVKSDISLSDLTMKIASFLT